MPPTPTSSSASNVTDRPRARRLLPGCALAFALVACGPAADSNVGGSPEASPTSPSAEPSSPASPTQTPAGTSALTPEPTDAPRVLAEDTIGEVVVTDLVVRSAPGVGEDSRILEIRLTQGDLVYVIAGPEPADGYDWLLVAELAPPSQSNATGWVAPASREGEEWVRFTAPDCPTEVSVVAFSSVPAPLLLECFGGEEITLEGALGFCGHGDPAIGEPAWLANESCIFEAPDRHGVPPEDWPAVFVHLDPGADVPSFTGEARPLRITGRFDSPAAEGCRYIEVAGLTLEPFAQDVLRFQCRLGFAVESAVPLD